MWILHLSKLSITHPNQRNTVIQPDPIQHEWKLWNLNVKLIKYVTKWTRLWNKHSSLSMCCHVYYYHTTAVHSQVLMSMTQCWLPIDTANCPVLALVTTHWQYEATMKGSMTHVNIVWWELKQWGNGWLDNGVTADWTTRSDMSHWLTMASSCGGRL